MIKPYLLIVGDKYYPEQGTGDWIGCYKTEEEAKEVWDGMRGDHFNYLDKWYEIVDLRDWVDWIGEEE